MPIRSKSAPWVSTLFALALLAIAALAMFDVVPQDVAQYSVLALPALAVSVPGVVRCGCGASS